ncbi:hypothetical protein EON65_26650 [archaeon]|nr:MAG: hypothetical protein EON65_26650 [archaeon]
MACQWLFLQYLHCLVMFILCYSCWGQLDGQGECTLRNPADGRIVPHKVLLFIDSTFFDVYRNWRMYFDNVCTGPEDYNNLELVCMDPYVDKLFNSTMQHCSKEYSSIVYDRKNSTDYNTVSKSSMVWMKRLEIINIMLNNGIHLILSDTDAFWLSNPYPDLNRHLANSHVIASRGWYPWFLSRLWGSTLCMGFVYIKADEFTINLFQEVLIDMKDIELHQGAFRHYLTKNETKYIDAGNSSRVINFNLTQWQHLDNQAPDDQYSINQVLLNMDIRWPENIASSPLNISHTGIVDWRGEQHFVTLLPETKYVRNCADSPLSRLGRMRYPSSRLRGIIRKRLANATVAHCLIAPGDGVKKQNYLVFYTLWQLPYNLSSVIDYIRADINNMSRLNRRNMTAKPGMKYFNTTSNSYVELVSLPLDKQQAVLRERQSRFEEILARLRNTTKQNDASLSIAIQSQLSTDPSTNPKHHSYYSRPIVNFGSGGHKLKPKFISKRRPRQQRNNVD